MTFNEESLMNFEMFVHIIEIFVVFVIGYTIYVISKLRKEKSLNLKDPEGEKILKEYESSIESKE